MTRAAAARACDVRATVRGAIPEVLDLARGARMRISSVMVVGPLAVLCASLAGAEAVELSVEDAVASALRSQPRLLAAASQVEAARQRARQAEWNRLGALETTFLYTPAQRPLRVDFPGIPPYVPATAFEVKQLQTYSTSMSLTQPLWTWGALASERGSARHLERASRQAFERARQQTTLEVSRAFFQAATAVAAVVVAEQNLLQQQAFLDVTRRRVQAGAAARLDELKAELAVARAESDLLEVKNRERLSREALVTLTDDARFRDAALKPLEESGPELADRPAAVDEALAKRLDLASLASQAEATRLGTRAVRGGRLPALVFRAQLTQQNDVFGEAFGRDSQLYQVGLAMSWNLADALRSGPKVAEMQALERGARHALRAGQEEVALEVRSVQSRAREARERVGVQARVLDVALEQARVARLAYSEGIITSVEAQDAELALASARFSLLRARLDAAVSAAELRCALGH